DKGILPDFITVDASEGGTGAAPIEYSNNIGLRGEEALLFVNETLSALKIRDKIKIIYAGKITSGVTMYKAFCRGADICNSARGFMFSLGCIQSLRCHTNTCPTGVATQNKELQKGLVPKQKSKRVEAYHRNTVDSFLEILAATGVNDIKDLTLDKLKHV
ncbi:MAG TPA: FMN-binding glutamate synthase family protein, partial [Epsilonproteobacteria bacterium]|nr:FMN-binding glutamate synthase family protein [Campylobacterota bacterium]